MLIYVDDDLVQELEDPDVKCFIDWLTWTGTAVLEIFSVRPPNRVRIASTDQNGYLHTSEHSSVFRAITPIVASKIVMDFCPWCDTPNPTGKHFFPVRFWSSGGVTSRICPSAPPELFPPVKLVITEPKPRKSWFYPDRLS